MDEAPDLLAASSWTCVGVAPGAWSSPADLGPDVDWLPVDVPGTAAGALRDAGRWRPGDDDEALLDGQDWWFRTTLPSHLEPAPYVLVLDGLATLADVWLDGEHLLRSENMFLAHRVDLDSVAPGGSLVVRCAALTPELARRRPRPRWRSLLVRSQNLRWFRTTLLGRIPGWSSSGAPVGPWRPVTLRAARPVEVLERGVTTDCRDGAGTVSCRSRVRTAGPIGSAVLRVGSRTVDLAATPSSDGSTELIGELVLDDPDVWWPHTHGDQPRYDVRLEVDDEVVELGQVGFRSVHVDRRDGGFTLVVNDTPIFARGACWVAPDVVTFRHDPQALRHSLQRVVDAGLNILRVGGYLTYESDLFWDCCDELGILVWQDVMLAGVDPPDSDEFLAALHVELTQLGARLRGRPALAVLCGSSESYQQAAMWGTPPETWNSRVLDHEVPAVLHTVLPDVPYVASSPSGGDLPFSPDTGVAHYFGVGAYLRPPTDARTAGVRFAAECLAFATPPESDAVERWFGGAAAAGHTPEWKAGVARDSRTSWDFEDVVTHYVRELFGCDPLLVRYTDPELALDLARATVLELMSQTLRAWRDPRSSSAGAIVLCWQDIRRGAGWGLLDADGDPKAPWWELRRLCAPVAAFVTDDGVGGLHAHVVNDSSEPVVGTLEIAAWTASGVATDQASVPVSVAARGSSRWSADRELGGFRDLTRAYRFGPPQHDAVTLRLLVDGVVVSEDLFLPGGCARPRHDHVGLAGTVSQDSAGTWHVTVTTVELAQFVVVEAPGHRASDSWFHLRAGGCRDVTLVGPLTHEPPRVTLRAVNSAGGPTIPVPAR